MVFVSAWPCHAPRPVTHHQPPPPGLGRLIPSVSKAHHHPCPRSDKWQGQGTAERDWLESTEEWWEPEGYVLHSTAYDGTVDGTEQICSLAVPETHQNGVRYPVVN